MRLLKPLIIMATLCSAAPVAAQQVVVDDNFRGGTFTWDGNGSAVFRWRPVLIDGNIAICGAYSVRGSTKYRKLTRQASADMRIEGASGVFLRNLSFFRTASSSSYGTQLRGEMANCRVTGIAGTPADLRQFSLEFTPNRYRY